MARVVAGSTRWKKRAAILVASLLGYIALALWSTWPLALNATSALPLTTMRVGTVPLFNLWTIWWNSDRLQHGLQHYWTAPIFHPAENTFAFSEPQPVTMLVAPVIWMTGSREFAYNSYLWLSLALNGFFAERLFRQLGVSRTLAVCGGFAMLLLPLVHHQLEVSQLVPIWGILWTLSACHRFSHDPTINVGVELGLAFGLTFLTCSHQGLLLSLLLTCNAWILPRRWLGRWTWRGLLTGVVAAAILVAPVAWKLHQAVHREEFRRKPDVVTQLSAQPVHYVSQTGLSWFERQTADGHTNRGFNPGWLKVVLAAVGIVIGLSRRRHRRWTAFLVGIGVVAFLLSQGPNLRIAAWQPWWTLTHMWPGLGQVRSVFRFAFFVQMVVVILAVQGLYGFWLLNRRLMVTRRWRTAIHWALLLLAIVSAVETVPARIKLFNTPNAVANSGWINFIRNHTRAGSGVACFPFPPGDNVDDYENETRWMYYGTYHGQPLANGYSGFFPADYFALQDAINARFPSPAALQKLLDAKVDLLVINRNVLEFPTAESFSIGTVTLIRLFQDKVGVDVYRLQKLDQPASQD